MTETTSEKSVFIQSELCKGCGLCVYFCPTDTLELSEEINQKGYNIAKVQRPENCISCNQCEVSCPDLAITVES